MKKKLQIILPVLLFVLILAGVLWKIAYVVRDKENGMVQKAFAALPKDSVDTVFVGNSHQFCNIDPDFLADTYGMNCFMLATPAQTIPMSYYAIMEAIALQHPKTIVFEISYAANDFTTVADGLTHAFFDDMPNCKAKKEGLADLVPKEEHIYYYLPFGMFHSRWSLLTEADYAKKVSFPRGGFVTDEVGPAYEIRTVEPTDTEQMPERMQAYFDKIIALCKENDVELILYAAPFGPLYYSEDCYEDLFYRQRVFNGVGEYAKENGIRFYNMFYELEDLNLDYGTDFMDAQHFSHVGQMKFSKVMYEKGYLN